MEIPAAASNNNNNTFQQQQQTNTKQKHSVEAVQALLQHKAAVNAQNKMTGATPLHCTAQSGKGSIERRIQCVKLLIAHGADLSKPDFFGKTAAEYSENEPTVAKVLQPQRPELFQAIQDEDVDRVKALVASNDDQQAVKMVYLGQTPFLYALDLLLTEDDDDKNKQKQQQEQKNKFSEIIQVLLGAGANVNEIPGVDSINNPLVALEQSCAPPLQRVCEALQTAYNNNNSNNNSDPNTADISCLEETCKVLLQYKATITPELEQLLHTACRKNEMDFAKYLINVIGVDSNVKGRQGMTALQFASRSGHLQMVEFLLSNPNVDPNIQDDRGKTALDAALVNDKQEIVTLLKDFSKAS